MVRLLWHDPSFWSFSIWPSTLTRTSLIYSKYISLTCWVIAKISFEITWHCTRNFFHVTSSRSRDAQHRWNSRINKFRFGWMILIWTFFILVLCQEIQNEWNFVTRLTPCRFIHDSVNFVTRATSQNDLPIIGYKTEIESARSSLLYRISIKGLLSSGFLRILVSFSLCSAWKHENNRDFLRHQWMFEINVSIRAWTMPHIIGGNAF